MNRIASLFTRALNRVIRIDRHDLFEVQVEDLAEVNSGINVLYRLGNASDLMNLDPVMHDFDAEARCYGMDRLAAGDLLVLGEFGGRVCFYCWICFGEVELACRRFLPSSADIAFVYKVFVVEDMRGKHVYPGVYCFLKPYLAQRGVRRIMTQINTKNTKSLRSILRCGYNCIGEFHRIRLFGASLYFVGRNIRNRIQNNPKLIVSSLTSSSMFRISVIIPAYNSADTIREAIESVLAQTVIDRQGAGEKNSRLGDLAIREAGSTTTQQPISVEIIVVDDCSTDGTAQIVNLWIREFGNSDGNKSSNQTYYRIITLEKNAGPATARNRGIAEAKGEWIAFLDADDAWLPEKLAVQMEMVAKHPEAAMWCGGLLCQGGYEGQGKGVREGRGQSAKSGEQRGDRENCHGHSGNDVLPEVIKLEDFAVKNPVATGTVLVRKDAVLVVGGFDEQFRGPEDYDLWMRIAAKYQVMKIETPLLLYRERQGSLSYDERKFLPQVSRVIDKAFSVGGVLYEYRHMKSSALSSQYNHASWMAFCRGARFAAIRCLLKSEWFALSSRCRTGRGSMDPFLSLFLRYVFGSSPGRSAVGSGDEGRGRESALKARWKRFKFVVGSLLSEPTVKICMRVDNEEGIKPESGDGWLHHYMLFSKPHSKFPLISSKTLGVALLPVPDDINAYIDSINGKNSAAYYARKAERRGYVIKEIDRNQYADDIFELRTSKPERQGRPIPERFRQKKSVFNNLIPNYHHWGVIDGHGKLAACSWVASYNEVSIISMLMGHADHLNNGVMYQLVVHIIKHAAEMKKSGSPVKYIMYDSFFGATSGMIMFKQKLGFKPYRVKWMKEREQEEKVSRKAHSFLITPDSPFILWKMHRFFLRKLRIWKNICLPDGRMFRVRYFAEGMFNYLFRVQGNASLLKITRAQYYNLVELVDGQVTEDNCRLMNSLAEKNLSAHCRYLCGGALLVEDAGKRVSRGTISDRKVLSDFFSRMKSWSIDQGVVVLDYNEGNWCMMNGVLRLVDIDVNFTCPLGMIRRSAIVLNRIQGVSCDTDEKALSAFLAREEELYWKHLTSGKSC